MIYPVVVREEEIGYSAVVEAIPGCCATEGDSLEELYANLFEAADGCLAAMAEAQEFSPKLDGFLLQFYDAQQRLHPKRICLIRQLTEPIQLESESNSSLIIVPFNPPISA